MNDTELVQRKIASIAKSLLIVPFLFVLTGEISLAQAVRVDDNRIVMDLAGKDACTLNPLRKILQESCRKYRLRLQTRLNCVSHRALPRPICVWYLTPVIISPSGTREIRNLTSNAKLAVRKDIKARFLRAYEARLDRALARLVK